MDYCMRAYGTKNSDHQINIHQYLLRTNSPNLMLTKFPRYIVITIFHYCMTIVLILICRFESGYL